MVGIDLHEVELDGLGGAPRDLHEAEAGALAAFLRVRPEFLFVESLQLLLVHIPDSSEPLPKAFDIGLENQVAGANDVIDPFLADGEDAIADFLERACIGCRRRWHMMHLGGIADDVLHLLYENGEHAAQRFCVGIVDGELLLQCLAHAA